ncbi:hypothetical protein PRIPAC_95565 [Pristionchus pacificus]|uniref:Uncharacterized protein n=1 Tax=Pristionchus pacificus TaxID=54126 RepID=A0A454XPL6_PRIPA|nr:hypothetical protein PRIPAC_95565 [Pristionchus pacificus]|eukprot:PDM60178.1 hypothetical protein PRIPAC_54003 [Pristionchus pacificus]
MWTRSSDDSKDIRGSGYKTPVDAREPKQHDCYAPSKEKPTKEKMIFSYGCTTATILEFSSVTALVNAK